MNSVTKLLTTLAILICSAAVAGAATLQAKVIDVQTGNTLIVSNTSRSVRVRLKAVVPPEAGQPFGEVARDHLKALVLDKTVVVEYTHLADGYLEARIFLNGIDIGSQMLRDGAAWYDRASDYALTESDRDLYAKCEQAARAEKRGLWEQESPVAPWEFRQVQQAKLNSIVAGNAGLQSKSRVGTKQATLSNDDLMGALAAGPRSSNAFSDLKPIAEKGSFDRWTSYESPTGHFSVMIPSNAVARSTVAPDANGQPVSIDLLSAGNERAFMVLFSGKGPNESRNDLSSLDQAIQGLIGGMNEAAAKRGSTGMLAVKPMRDLKLADYVGRQYSLTGVSSGTARVFTKQVGTERQIFVLFALTRPGGEGLGDQFLNSFKITP